MGFSQFWQVVNFQSEQLPSLHEENCFDFNGFEDRSRPWIVIDWNNYAMSYVLSDGGFPELAVSLFQQHFTAILNSGARICIIRDGKFNEQRLLIKLRRVYNSLIESIDSSKSSSYQSPDAATAKKYVVDSNELVRSVVMRCAMEMVQSYIKRVGCGKSNIDDASAPFIYHKADQEADDAIRAFCAQKLSQGDTVYVLSGDASLVLGVPKPELLHLVNVSSFKLSEKLSASTVNVGKFVERLNVLSNMMCALPGKVQMEHLPSIVALIDSEASRYYTGNQYFDPRRIVEFMKEFFAPKKKVGSRALGLFLMATVVTKAMLHQMNRTSYTTHTASEVLSDMTAFPIAPGTYRRFIDDVVAFAEHLVIHGQFGKLLIAGFPPHREAAASHLSNVARSILQHSEMKFDIPLAMVASVIRSDSTNSHKPTTHTKDKRAEVRFLSTHEWYPASIRTVESSSPQCISYQVMYDANDASPQYNRPCGLRSELAREHTVREICQRIALSSVSTRDVSLSSTSVSNDQHQLWDGLQFGVWCQHEPMSQETEKMLMPLISLVRQSQFVKESVLPWLPNRDNAQDTKMKGKFAELSELSSGDAEVTNLLNKWQEFVARVNIEDNKNAEFESWMVEMKTLILQLEDAHFRLTHSSIDTSDIDVFYGTDKNETAKDTYAYDAYDYDYDGTGNGDTVVVDVSQKKPSISTQNHRIKPQRARHLMTSKVYLMQKQRTNATLSGGAVHYTDFAQLFTHFAWPHPESGSFAGNPLLRHGVDIFSHGTGDTAEREPPRDTADHFAGVVIVKDVAALHTPPESAQIDVEKVVGLWCGYVADDPQNVTFSRFKDYRLSATETLDDDNDDDDTAENKAVGVLLNVKRRWRFLQSLCCQSKFNLTVVQHETAFANGDTRHKKAVLRREAICVLCGLFSPVRDTSTSDTSTSSDDTEAVTQALSALTLTETDGQIQQTLRAIERYLSDVDDYFRDSHETAGTHRCHALSAALIFALLYALRHMCLPPLPEAVPTTKTTAAFATRIRVAAEQARVSLLQRWAAAVSWAPFFGQWSARQLTANLQLRSLQECEEQLQAFHKMAVAGISGWTDWSAKTTHHIDVVDVVVSQLVSFVSRGLESSVSLDGMDSEVREVTNESVCWFNSLGMAMAFQVLETEALCVSTAVSEEEEVDNTVSRWIQRLDTDSMAEEDKRAKVKAIAVSWDTAMRHILSTLAV